jgi:ABC-type uncharacterized transport system permease subunit
MPERWTTRAIPTLVTLVAAFVVAGLVVAATGHNPFPAYAALVRGAGVDWPLQWVPGNPFDVDAVLARANLIATIVQATPLVLTGLAVSFALRAGLFNIGGTGQMVAGALGGFAVTNALNGPLGLTLGMIAGAAAGAALGAVAGALKGYRSVSEVISTIMLNYIAVFLIRELVGIGGALQDASTGQGTTSTLATRSVLPVLWGEVQGVHLGAVIALLAAAAYKLLIDHTSFGFAVRAVGANRHAAAYAGTSVRVITVCTLAVAGAFGGLAGAGEVAGVQHRLTENFVATTQIGFVGIAVALLGRATASGVVLAALLFGGLDSGSRALSGAFPSDLARPLATVIQGTVILLVGAEAIVRWRLERRASSSPPSSPARSSPAPPGTAPTAVDDVAAMAAPNAGAPA